MPYFLTRDDLFKLFQRELPEDVYPNTPPTGSFSAASIDAKAGVLETAYTNLQTIYDNYFPLHSTESLGDWYITVFNNPAANYDDLATQRGAVIGKLRARNGFTKPEMKGVVQSIIGIAHPIDLIEYGCETGSWVIDYSQLGVETFLGMERATAVVGSDLCGKGPSDFGLTQAQWDDLRYQAYTYEVRIYGYTLTADERARLEVALTQQEPARSNHVIRDNVPLDQQIDGTD